MFFVNSTKKSSDEAAPEAILRNLFGLLNSMPLLLVIHTAAPFLPAGLLFVPRLLQRIHERFPIYAVHPSARPGKKHL
jgi:hypothetical protein